MLKMAAEQRIVIDSRLERAPGLPQEMMEFPDGNAPKRLQCIRNLTWDRAAKICKKQKKKKQNEITTQINKQKNSYIITSL